MSCSAACRGGLALPGVVSVQLLGAPSLEQHHLGQRTPFLRRILGQFASDKMPPFPGRSAWNRPLWHNQLMS